MADEETKPRVLILVLFVTCGGPTCGGAGSVALWLLLLQPKRQQNNKPSPTTINADHLLLNESTRAKMLLDEDPSTLIHHTIGNFNIHPDKQAVTRINDSLSTLQQSRELRSREAESVLRKLSRNLNSLNAQHEEAVSAHDSGRHAQDIVELDTKKFRIAKAASELEIESERLESELEILKERLADLEAQGLEGDEGTRREREADDATILRLKIYRSLGIDIEPDEAGNFTKAVIRNSRKGDVHVVNVDSKFSRFFYSNYFWGTMQG